MFSAAGWSKVKCNSAAVFTVFGASFGPGKVEVGEGNETGDWKSGMMEPQPLPPALPCLLLHS